MIINTFTIVLGETLEAGLLGSVMVFVCQRLNISTRILWIAAVVGLCGAAYYGTHLAEISNAFDYTGQEWVNGTISLVVFLCLLLLAFQLHTPTFFAVAALFTCTAVVVVHEGSELYIFYSSVPVANLGTIGLSGLVGLAVGASLGVLVYYLMLMSGKWQVRIAWLLMSLVGSGMALQASQYFVQADVLPALEMLWNTEWLLSERSNIGQLLTATLRYESTPSWVELITYLSALSAFAFIVRNGRHVR